MRTKRTIPFFILILLIATLALCFAACDTQSGDGASADGHTHTFSAWETTTAPTCAAQGMQQRSCESCGFSEYSPVATIAHTEVIDEAVPATCTENGKTKGKHCSVCNAVIQAQGVVPKTGHAEVVDAAVAPTCTKDGKTAGKHCSVCKTVTVAQTTLPKTDHNYNNGLVLTAATCLQSGSKKFSCTNPGCNHSYNESYSLPTYTATELYEQAVDYTGEIVVYDKNGSELGLGTCFVISADGRIVTNYHVISGAYSATVYLGGRSYPVSFVLAYDAVIDLAVLKINATRLTAAKVCKRPVSTGATVYAIGSSRGMTNTYSQGIITYADRVVDGVSHVQHDASITHGNSGGPLINVYGEVIGINTWGISESQNLNFAVFAGELDHLIYGTPITMAAFYEKTNDVFARLVDLICKNGIYNSVDGTYELFLLNNYTTDNAAYTTVAFVYNPDDGSVDLFHYVSIPQSEALVFTGLALQKNADSYFYGTYIYVNDSLTNAIVGYVQPATLTENTLLGYAEYEGSADKEAATRETASAAVIALVGCLEIVANEYLGATIADFGFLVF